MPMDVADRRHPREKTSASANRSTKPSIESGLFSAIVGRSTRVTRNSDVLHIFISASARWSGMSETWIGPENGTFMSSTR